MSHNCVVTQLNSLPQLNLPEGGQPRMWHTATALNLWPGRTQVITFGGTPKWERGKSDTAQQKLAKTAVVEFGELHGTDFPSSTVVGYIEWK